MNLEKVRRFIRRYHWTTSCMRCHQVVVDNPFRNHHTNWYYSIRPRSVGIGGGSIEEDIRRSLDVEPELKRKSKLLDADPEKYYSIQSQCDSVIIS